MENPPNNEGAQERGSHDSIKDSADNTSRYDVPPTPPPSAEDLAEQAAARANLAAHANAAPAVEVPSAPTTDNPTPTSSLSVGHHHDGGIAGRIYRPLRGFFGYILTEFFAGAKKSFATLGGKGHATPPKEAGAGHGDSHGHKGGKH
ncbi:MAG: hypothetical protein JWL75_184 [Parcubacteria group bacterium]|nr:hypothetical protein [Parcubacteria group bacterium]